MKLRLLGELVGGPHDGVTLAGWNLPSVIHVDAEMLEADNKRKKIIFARKPEREGRYDASDPKVRIRGEWVDIYSCSDDEGALDTETLLDADKVRDEDGDDIVLASVIYHWSFTKQKGAK